MFAPVVRGDENAGLLHYGVYDKENSSVVASGSGRGLGQAAGAKNVLQPVQPGSVRKALGNITNTASKQQQQQQQQQVKGSGFGAASDKGGKAAPARRAFGVDITNSGSLKQLPPSDSSTKRRPLQAFDTCNQVPQNPQTSLRQQLLPKSKAELYAEGGVERLAGKSFREQEADRLQQEENDIDQRVKQLTSALGMWKPQGAGAGGHSDLEDEDLNDLSLTPSRLRPWTARHNQAADADDVPLLLPDSPPAVWASHAAGYQQRAPFITILPDPELDVDFDELM